VIRGRLNKGTSALAPRMQAASIRAVAIVGQWAGQGDRKLSSALVRNLLAFGVRVGKEPADGQQQHRAQPESQPCSHQQPRGFAHRNRGHQDKEEGQSALPAVACADAEADQREQWEEDVDAHFDAHPTAQRD
jgi:hypothetical protein